MLRPDSTVGFLECPALQRWSVNIQRERRQPAAAGARMQPGCNCSLPFIPRRGLGRLFLAFIVIGLLALEDEPW